MLKIINNLFCYSFPCYLIYQYFIARGLVGNGQFLAIAKFLVIITGLLSFFSIKNKNAVFGMITIFIIYTILSVFQYTFNNKPISCYFDAINNFIIPIFMFYVGMNSRMPNNKFITLFAVATSISVLLTIPAYVTFAPWYVNYVHSNWLSGLQTSSFEYKLETLRFGGVFADSYGVMYLCFPVFVFCLYEIFVKKTGNVFMYFVAALNAVSLLLCQQRTAMFFLFASLLYFLVIGGHKLKNILILAIIGFVFAYLFIKSNAERFADIALLLQDRSEKMSFFTAFEERRDKVFSVFSVWDNVIFGDGVGVYSHEAFRKGLISVNDNGWIKLLVENGIIGLLLFISIVVTSLRKALKNMTNYHTEIIIIIFYLVAMIGSDSLSMMTAFSIFFWFAIGRIWNLDKPSLDLNSRFLKFK